MRKYLLAATLVATFQSMAQSSDLTRAEHLIGQVERGLKTIRQNDTDTINGYTDKLQEAMKLLEAEPDKQTAEFRKSAEHWKAARAELYATFERWKQNNAQPSAPAQTASSASTSAQRYDELIKPYQQQHRPAMPATTDVQASLKWLQSTMQLIGAKNQQDNARAQQWYQSGALSKADYERYQRWVNGTFQQQIVNDINNAFGQWNQRLNSHLNQAQYVLAVSSDDVNKTMNTAGGQHYKNNKLVLDEGVQLVTLLSQADPMAGLEQQAIRQQQSDMLTQALNHLNKLAPLAEQYLAETAKLPKKSKTNPTSQYVWRNGSRFAEITEKGEVWINSSFAGNIEDDGEIWVKGSSVGSIEQNGEVWRKGSFIGTIEDNGKVWLKGSHVATLNPNGNVSAGTGAVSFEGPGDWRRAAIVLFYPFF